MAKRRYDIFISYRRTDGKDIARALKESLAARGYRVFLDYDALQDGVFDRRILDAIDAAPIYILLLTAHCLDRCVNENDWVRLELEHALTHGKQIVPLVPDKQFTTFPDDTPDFIRKGLGQHQYSALDTGQLYLASVEQLDAQRIKPVLRRRTGLKIMIGVCVMLAIVCLSLLGYFYYRSSRPIIHYEQAMTYAEITSDSAMHYLSLAAEEGLPIAQRTLADAYLYRTDISSHQDKAFYWYQRACFSGDTLAIASLGRCYQYGIGIPVDLAEAISLYREGAELGEPTAMYYLGLCTRDGVGIAADVVAGWEKIADASFMGCKEAEVEYSQSGYWIFTPTCDSTTTKITVLRAICLNDSITNVYLRWTNRQYVGGWMSVDRGAYIEDALTKTRYTICNVEGCRFAPDTTSVPWGMSHDFMLQFPAIPESVSIIHICESDSSLWKWFGVRLNRP